MGEHLQKLAKLQLLVDEGLNGFDLRTDLERRILLAAALVTQGDVALSKDIRAHALLNGVSQTTYHRALLRLIERDLLVPTAAWSGSYRLNVST